jgi:DNA repair exonuclease SbcCD ATPase subunit
MDNVLIKNLNSKKKNLILNIYENNVDCSIDKTNLCNNSINCIDISCFKSHYVDFNNRELINNIIDQKDEIEKVENEIDEIDEIDEIENEIDEIDEIDEIEKVENEIDEIEKVENEIDEIEIEKQLTELSKEIKQDLNEIKATEEYLKILHTKLNQKKNKAKEITKQFIKLI